MANVGDKFIIEIEEEFHGNDIPNVPIYDCNRLYKIKGFNSLVFDENGLGKLEKYEESPYTQSDCDRARKEGYEQGLKDAWEAARKIGDADRKLDKKFRNYLVGIKSGLVEELLSPDEAISKIKVYEEQKKEEGEINENKTKVLELANKIGIHELYAIVKEIRGE